MTSSPRSTISKAHRTTPGGGRMELIIVIGIGQRGTVRAAANVYRPLAIRSNLPGRASEWMELVNSNPGFSQAF